MVSSSAAGARRYRGVRQRQWGSWVSEIRHSISKTRIWLGTFDTAKKAAKAYDEAARLMEGANAKTNFPPPSTATSLLSASVRARLQQCNCLATLGGKTKLNAATEQLLRASSTKLQLCANRGSTTSMLMGGSGQNNNNNNIHHHQLQHSRSRLIERRHHRVQQTLVCLRLDDAQDQLGVMWQASSDAKPHWVTKLHVPPTNTTATAANVSPPAASNSNTKNQHVQHQSSETIDHNHHSSAAAVPIVNSCSPSAILFSSSASSSTTSSSSSSCHTQPASAPPHEFYGHSLASCSLVQPQELSSELLLHAAAAAGLDFGSSVDSQLQPPHSLVESDGEFEQDQENHYCSYYMCGVNSHQDHHQATPTTTSPAAHTSNYSSSCCNSNSAGYGAHHMDVHMDGIDIGHGMDAAGGALDHFQPMAPLQQQSSNSKLQLASISAALLYLAQDDMLSSYTYEEDLEEEEEEEEEEGEHASCSIMEQNVCAAAAAAKEDHQFYNNSLPFLIANSTSCTLDICHDLYLEQQLWQ